MFENLVCKVLTGSLVWHFMFAETPVTDADIGNAKLQFWASKRLWGTSTGKAVFLVSIIPHSAAVCRNKHSREGKKPLIFDLFFLQLYCLHILVLSCRFSSLEL